MDRESRNAKTGGNILVPQKRIGCHPAPKFACELSSLLHSGFRHQDNELISAVARHHIGPPTVLFEYVSHALKHNVAFQVSVEIINELEAVEIHQDQCKWP